jgi:N-methylhydantoinase A
MTTAAFDTGRAATALDGLRQRSSEFVAAAGHGVLESSTRFTIEARYPHQVWEIEVPVDADGLASGDGVEAFRGRFHAAHEELYAVRDADAPVEIVTWRAHVRCTLRRSDVPPARPERSQRAVAAERAAYFPALGVVDTPVRTLDALAVGERAAGPLLIESPVTTVVLDERATVERAPSGSLLVDPLGAAEVAATPAESHHVAGARG